MWILDWSSILLVFSGLTFGFAGPAVHQWAWMEWFITNVLATRNVAFESNNVSWLMFTKNFLTPFSTFQVIETNVEAIFDASLSSTLTTILVWVILFRCGGRFGFSNNQTRLFSTGSRNWIQLEYALSRVSSFTLLSSTRIVQVLTETKLRWYHGC